MLDGTWWSAHAVVGVSVVVTVIIIPLYVGVLAERLVDARLKAEQALEECRRSHDGKSMDRSREPTGG